MKRTKQSKVYLVLSVLSGICGALWAWLTLEYSGFMENPTSIGGLFLKLLIWFVTLDVVMFLRVLLHEGGHLICGLITGYRFRSFRVRSLMLLHDGQRLRLCRLRLAGTGGQCLMTPPDLKNGEMPCTLYNLGGCIFDLLGAAISVAGFLLVEKTSYWSVFFSLLALMTLVSVLTNGIPMRTAAIHNDGQNMLDLTRYPEATHALWLQLKIFDNLAKNQRLRDLPQDWFPVYPDALLNNGLVSAVAVLGVQRLMDEGRLEKADREAERLLSGEAVLTGVHRLTLSCERVFLEIVRENRPIVVRSLMNKDVERVMKRPGASLTAIRMSYAHAMLVRNDLDTARKLRARFLKALKRYPYSGDAQTERELMSLVDSKY